MAEEELGFREMMRIYVAVFLLEFSVVLEIVICREEFRYKGVILKGKTNQSHKYTSETVKNGVC